MYLYNSATHKKAEFTTHTPNHVEMYTCGPTVYHFAHIGNLRSYIMEDVLEKFLRYQGYDVNRVMNITDVGHLTSDADEGEDKMLKGARREHKTVMEIAKFYTDAFFEDCRKLNIKRPDVVQPATGCIDEYIKIITTLLEKGYAYQDKNGDVDFSVRKFKPYGALSGKKVDELQPGERVRVEEAKQDPLDFALWKRAKPGEPEWDSKWGKGRPGWHIECSAMSCDLLGETFDIHGGGPDLMFPHHENEIAQSEAANGKKFVNTWMHSGPLRVNGEKMSKSLGNFWTIRDALKETNTQYGDKNGNETLRFFLLRSHYRSPIDFSSALVEDAHQALIRLYTALKNTPADDNPLDWNEKYAAQFKEAMDDDFNTAQAVAVLFELAKEVNQTKSPELARQLKKLGGVLGILQLDPEAFVKGAVDSVDEAAVEALIAERKAAKAAKNWARADEIRKELLEKNIVLEDAPGGVTTWRRA